MSNHHTHQSHTHNFINKYTAPAILIIIVGCFVAGYFVGKYSVPQMYKRYSDQAPVVLDGLDYRPY